MKLKNTLLVAFSLFTFSQVSAQIVTDRPDQTESSATVGRGNLQIESGVVSEWEGDTSSREILAPTSLFRYGLVDNLEFRLLTQFEINKVGNTTGMGMTDTELGFKWQVFSKNGTEIALLSHLVLPTGTATPYKGGNFGTINKVSISHEISDVFSIGHNVGYDYMKGDTGVNGNLTYSLAFGIGVNDKVAFFVEPYGAFENFDEFKVNFDAGMTYLATDNLQFDFSFGTGLTHRYNFISAGFSWLWLKPTKKEIKK